MAAQAGDVDQAVGRIGRRLDQDHADAALGGGSLRDRQRICAHVDAVGEAEGGDAEGAIWFFSNVSVPP